MLAPIAWSFALLGLNVTGYYTLLAFGRVRTVTWLNLAGGAAMLLVMAFLTPRAGIRGIAIARLVYGQITLFMYGPVVSILFARFKSPLPALGTNTVCEGS